MRIDLLGLIGAGGHAKVVYDAALKAKLAERIAVYDDDARLNGAAFFRLRITAPIGAGEALPGHVHVAVGDNRARAALAARLTAAGKRLLAVVHPAAITSEMSELAPGAFAAAGAIVAPSAAVAECAIINHGAIVDHDCAVGRYAHIAPGAILGGGVRVGEGALVGAGAVILPGIAVGNWTVVGAGAVVTRPVADNAKVYGAPAKTNNDA
jgi:sugar O-acyltransferase (sialic acid O-acetyltransferase NeuD family)